MRPTGWAVTAGAVDVTVRPSHVASAAIQELLCGAYLGTTDSADAGGPRIDPASVTLVGTKQVTFRVDRDLHAASVKAPAFGVSYFREDTGWTETTVVAVSYDQPSKTVTATLKDAFDGKRVRLLVRGTGKTPVLGTNFIPLAGASGGPAGTVDDGIDFVSMKARA